MTEARKTPKWKDKTKGYPPVVIGSEIRLGSFRLSIHRHIAYDPDVWLASCSHHFSAKVLRSKNLDDAKKEALDLFIAAQNRSMDDAARANYVAPGRIPPLENEAKIVAPQP